MDFCSSPIFEVLFGGSAGGGKSDALLGESLRQVDHPQYRAIIFRRKIKQLRNLIDRSLDIFYKAFPAAKWKESEKTWVMPSGARIMLWHMEEEKNKYDHDGQQYHYIGWDELTHFTQTQYTYLMSRARTANPDLRCYIRASAMPMGAGITWVKNRFIDNGPYNVVKDEGGLERVFIPSKLDDNKKLIENDPQYENRLKLLGPKLFRALRKGDWDVIEGAYFEELDKDVHAPKPHIPAAGTPVWTCLDWGYAKPFSVGWYYENSDKQIVRFAEWYGMKNNEPDTGLRMGAREVARGIIKHSEEMSLSLSHHIADPACWNKIDDEPSIAEAMMDEGLYLQKANHDRVQGWMEVHNRLRLEDGRPGLLVTEDCKHFWRTMPMLQSDPNKPEDLDTKMEDHIGDEVRYSVMSKPLYMGALEVSVGGDLVTGEAPWQSGMI